MDGLGKELIVDDWEAVLRTLILGPLTYMGLVIMLRASGKRTLSKMNAFDFVVTVAFGSLLASVMTSPNISLVRGLLALGLLIALQWISTFLSVRWPWFQQIIKSEATLVFFKGDFLREPMRRQRVTQAEIVAAIRQHGFPDLHEVDAVILETEGSLSVLKHKATTKEDLIQLGVEVPSSWH